MVKNIKMELKDTLRPIERLYLISKEKEDVFNKKNRLYTLLYFYVVNENISIGGDKNIKLNYDGKGFNSTYEELGLDLLKEKKWLDFNTFLDGLHFNKTLVDNGILKMEVKVKKRFFLNLAKNEITKSTKYYSLLACYNEHMENNTPVLDLVCEGREHKDKVHKIYNIIKTNMKEEKIKEQSKPKKNDVDLGEAFNMKGD